MLTLGKLQNASQHPQSGVYHQEYYRYVILDAMQKDMGDSRHQPQGTGERAFVAIQRDIELSNPSPSGLIHFSLSLLLKKKEK